MQDDFLDLDIKQDHSHIIRDSAEQAEDAAADRAAVSPSPFDHPAEEEQKQGGRRGDVRMFLFGFGVMVLFGLGWTFLKPAVEGADAASIPYWDKIKGVASDIAEIPEKNWFKDRTVYFTSDGNGVRIASDEEVSAHKQWREDMKNAIEDYEEEMRMYDDE